MLVDLLDVDQVNRTGLTFLIDGSVCSIETNCPIPAPFSLQDMVSVSWNGPRGGKPLYGHQVDP